MRILYTFFIRCFSAAMSVAAWWNEKAKLGKVGRKNWHDRLVSQVPADRKTVWFHCASLGEFDQGLPVMERLKEEHPDLFLVVSFFSPSGYEYRKNHPIADAVCYLPFDTPKNARRLVKAIHPQYAVFVKYEFWYNFLNTLYLQQVPTYFISSNFRPSQPFFKWYGGWFRQHLAHITAFFVQNEASKQLLESIGVRHVSVSGDTRFDRVAKLASQSIELPVIQAFKGDSRLLVAGSSWQPEEELLQQLLQQAPWDHLKVVVAPHDISEGHIQQIERRFPQIAIRYTAANVSNVSHYKVLIINNIGLLNKIYHYGDIAFIGGGFSGELHNILEAACYGLPVIFGSKTDKFPEAAQLAAAGGGFPVDSYSDFLASFELFYHQSDRLFEAQQRSAAFVRERVGATERILAGVEP